LGRFLVAAAVFDSRLRQLMIKRRLMRL
jgi:hypothetical protein